MLVLVTAFDAFGGEKINASWEALKLLSEEIGGSIVIKKQLPTVFKRSFEDLRAHIEANKPDIVLSLGQAAGRSGISIERVAINIDDARIPDNDGNQPIDEPIVDNGPSAFFSTLPIKAMAAEIHKLGIEASISNTAGTFVCNHIMYLLLHHTNSQELRYRGGFIHIPCIKEQVEEKPQLPYMELQDIVKGLEAAIEAACREATDIKEIGGELY